MADQTDRDVLRAREQLLDDKCDYEEFEHNGVELKIREMRVPEYMEFTKLSTTNAADFIPFVLPMVTLRDGRQVLGEEHVDSLMDLPHQGSVAGKIHHNFLVVNGFLVEGETTVDQIRAAAMQTDDDEQLGVRLREMLQDDEAGTIADILEGALEADDDEQLGAAVRDALAVEGEEDEGKSTSSETD